MDIIFACFLSGCCHYGFHHIISVICLMTMSFCNHMLAWNPKWWSAENRRKWYQFYCALKCYFHKIWNSVIISSCYASICGTSRGPLIKHTTVLHFGIPPYGHLAMKATFFHSSETSLIRVMATVKSQREYCIPSQIHLVIMATQTKCAFQGTDKSETSDKC